MRENFKILKVFYCCDMEKYDCRIEIFIKKKFLAKLFKQATD